jgi:glycosyltransferase involved in cell wall biosynthesis
MYQYSTNFSFIEGLVVFTLSEMAKSNAKVLVICSAYNQEKYIADALKGFVSQKTTFPFLVLVHDDASTDSTASIIKGFESHYPEMIRGIYETENQYQQGRYFWYLPFLRKSGAKYLALCEGDDYWTDSNKLQRQYEILEKDSDGVFCFSNAEKIDASTGRSLGQMMPSTSWEKSILDKEGPLSADDVIRLNFIPTASFFARIDAWLQEPKLPDSAFGGDRAHQLFLAIRGNSYYIDSPTVVYRIATSGSMMASWQSSKASQIKSIKKYISLYEFFDEYTHGRYRNALSPSWNDRKLSLMFATANSALMKRSDAIAAAKCRGSKYELLTRLFFVAPSLVKKLWERRFSS